MKQRYFDLMERTLSAYSEQHILRYFHEVKSQGLKEHGFPRLTANIGILISYGRGTDLYDTFIEMMDFCCTNIPCVKAANDFSVKELVFCIMELEKTGAVPKGKLDQWKNQLKSIIPQDCYTTYAVTPDEDMNNWACFTAVSEFMRCYIGIADTYDFIDIQIATQLRLLDENGMYMDPPGEPMVYDLVTRGLFAVLLHFGYNGKYKTEIDECLRKTGLLTLKMQSVIGEIPYGGRSNQFPHNEAHLALIMEFEANRYKMEGNMLLASQFKAAANRTLDSITYWLYKEPTRHIKNRFPTETQFGCETYAYFDKYMITLASFLYVANLFCDETISAASKEMETCYTLTLSSHFHKLFLRSGAYFAEFDTKADMHYDASGLGRIHRKDAPPVICLSTPCASKPSYKLGISNAVNLSLCPGVRVDGEVYYGEDPNSVYTLIEHCSTGEDAICAFTVDICGKKTVTANYTLNDTGMAISIAGDGVLLHKIPAFCFDGEQESRIKGKGNVLEIYFDGWVCRYKASCEIKDTGKQAFNRNGLYKMFRAEAQNRIDLHIEICKC